MLGDLCDRRRCDGEPPSRATEPTLGRSDAAEEVFGSDRNKSQTDRVFWEMPANCGSIKLWTAECLLGSVLTIFQDTPKAVSRRRFIKGVIAGGAAVSSVNYLFRAATSGAAGSGGERLITLNVNGRVRRVEIPKQETLAWTLRYKLGLTGTKLGCDRAECGACTVLIDDVPHYSCSALSHTVRGRHIVTIEGLAAPDGTLHPMQQGVIDEQGFQCAFCMSGFIMAAVGFLKTNPNPTRSELAHGVSGNLCRCQDYDKILSAMMRGAENLRGANHA
jgi:aerobic-type carbon monoxide dehydrogenase small subunit (CoxS/CutS family)